MEYNQIIGDGYTFIDRECNYDEFCKTFKVFFGKDHVADLDKESDKDTMECYAFICNGEFTQPLYKNKKTSL
jgi:hypothetical protein